MLRPFQAGAPGVPLFPAAPSGAAASGGAWDAESGRQGGVEAVARTVRAGLAVRFWRSHRGAARTRTRTRGGAGARGRGGAALRGAQREAARVPRAVAGGPAHDAARGLRARRRGRVGRGVRERYAWPGEKTEDVLRDSRASAARLHRDREPHRARRPVQPRPARVAGRGRHRTSTIDAAAQGDDQLLDRIGELAGRRSRGRGRPRHGARAVASVDVVGAPDEAAARPRSRSQVGEPFDDELARRTSTRSALCPTWRPSPSTPRGARRASTSPIRVVVDGAARARRRGRDGGARTRRGARARQPPHRGRRRFARASHERDRLVSSRAARQGRARDLRARLLQERARAEEEVAGGVAITFAVEENPIVRQVSVTGNDERRERQDQGQPDAHHRLDARLPAAHRERAAHPAALPRRGLLPRRREVRGGAAAGDSVAVHFTVEEGEKSKLRKIEFVGNEKPSDERAADGRVQDQAVALVHLGHALSTSPAATPSRSSCRI